MGQALLHCTTALHCSVGGSLAGGWLLSARSLPTSLVLRAGTAVRCLPILLQAWLVQVWSPAQSALLLPLGLASHALAAFLAGLITTATFTAMMSVSRAAGPGCQARCAAPHHCTVLMTTTSLTISHFSLLATCEVLGKLVFASLAGLLTDWLGVEQVFILLALLGVLAVPLVSTLPQPQQLKSR